MAIMSVARCPKCHIEVGTTWRWCLACGYDPDGSAQRVRQAAIEARQREGGWLPVLIVLIGLVVGGAILWKTTPDDTPLPTESPSIAAEVSEWVPFAPPSGAFHVELPATPVATTAEPTRSGRPVDSYAIVGGDHLYTVSVIETGRTDLTRGNDPALESALRAYVDDLAASVSGEVTRAEVNLGAPTPMLDFEIDHAIVGRMRGRVAVLVDPGGPNPPAAGGAVPPPGRLAGVSITSKQLSDELANHVIDSFVAQ
jgi:hypothetical protein